MIRREFKKFNILAVALVALVPLASGVREVFFVGTVRAPFQQSLSNILDMHVHAAGIGAGGSGCFISKGIRDSFKFRAYLEAFGTSLEELEAHSDKIVITKIAASIRESKTVTAAVILALDQVYDPNGEPRIDLTELFVPNDYLIDALKSHDHLYLGASVHPFRPDALEALEWVAQNGAVLIKWIPPVQRFNPSDQRLVAFYKRLIALNLPLLTHTGKERAFSQSIDEWGDPTLLKLPLELGVTVIAAHAAATGDSFGEDNFERLLPLMRRYPNLYADVSSLTQINKKSYLAKLLDEPEIHDQLIYGSDFPLNNTPLVSPWYFPLRLQWARMNSISQIKNVWDQDVALKQSLGLPSEVFLRSRLLLGR